MSRSVLRIGGADRVKFLQTLITNDISHLDQAPVYAALLTPQGKFLADFFLIEDGDSILLDAHSDLAAGLMQRLTMYRLRADVQIAMTDLKVTRGAGPMPKGAWADPRHPALGWRLYGDTETSETTDFDAIRVDNLIPEYPHELKPNESFILEWQLDRLHGIDFRKGCYVGQEVTARMKHKTTLKKGIARLCLKGEAAPGTPITLDDGREIGTICTTSGPRALAWLRYDLADLPMNAAGHGVLLNWQPSDS
ncbi:MAG: folate-binding protein [Deltaproteobacteria bacterium]